MPYLDNSFIALIFLPFIVGLGVGSFLNVLALRTLHEQSLFSPASQCLSCNTRLGYQDLIPVLSFLFLQGKCRSCHKPISWQYPCVEIVTAILFVLIIRNFGWNTYSLGMLVFMSTLIAVCITDFREKLIPHEITYPAILLGIAFSAAVRNDVAGTLSGIAISYIFFDFLAFYGLKIYLWWKQPGNGADPNSVSMLSDEGKILVAGQKTRKDLKMLSVSATGTPFFFSREPLSTWLKPPLRHLKPILPPSSEDIEVIGGGDAVLSALISAWLGLPRLLLALVLGFAVGTFMGAAYLIHEMHKQRLLQSAIKPALVGAGYGLLFVTILFTLLSCLVHHLVFGSSFLLLGLLAAVAGGLLATVSLGSKVSKPFPFGPALVAGATIAIFHDPFGGFGP